jgi:iron complex transport system substrate-binding protein
MEVIAWRRWSQLLCLWLLPMGAGAGSAVASAQIVVTDDRGAVVALPAPPQRIVSMLPSLTEAVCVLGACERLVATDRWSNWPEPVARLPKLGGLEDANVERILAMRPDVVLVASSSRLSGRLRALGLRVAELDASDLGQVRRMLDKVAMLIGQPQRAVLQWQRMQDELHMARMAVPESAKGLGVYVEVSSAPYAASESSYIGQLLTQLGVRNVVPAALGPFPKLNPEFVVKTRPALIVVSAGDREGLRQRPGWGGLDAVRRGGICALAASDMDVLSRPGPRIGQAAWVLAACLRDHSLAGAQ